MGTLGFEVSWLSQTQRSGRRTERMSSRALRSSLGLEPHSERGFAVLLLAPDDGPAGAGAQPEPAAVVDRDWTLLREGATTPESRNPADRCQSRGFGGGQEWNRTTDTGIFSRRAMVLWVAVSRRVCC